MKCIHEKTDYNGNVRCDMDNEICIGCHPEHEPSDCQFFERPRQKEEEEYLNSLTEEDLKKIEEEVA